MIEAKDLTKQYSGSTVLNIPSLAINGGESFGLVGNNGAGKTTFFRLILDILRATSGCVLSKEENVMQSEHWKSYTGSYLDEGFLIDFLTPEEFFEFIGKTRGLSKGDIHDFNLRFEEFFNGEILGQKKFIRDFSKGNQKKIGISAAMMSRPEMLILDEPFANLDPSTQIRLKKMLKELKDEGNTTMLISSHDLSHVTEVCERIVVLEKGELVHDMNKGQDTLQELEEYFTA